MSRTILTTLTVLMTVFVMYIWGGEGIKGFAFTMLIGCISGTYSTFAIASPMVYHKRAMWLVTIIVAALTLSGLVIMAASGPVLWVLVGIIVAAAVYVLVKNFSTNAAPTPRSGFPVSA